MDTVTLKLSAQTYNTIMQGLQELPWRIAQPAIQEINPQIHAALAKDGQKPSKASKREDQK